MNAVERIVEFGAWLKNKNQGLPVQMDLCASMMLIGLRAAARTIGPILDLGGGAYSSFLLHWACPSRQIITLETDEGWYRFLLPLKTPNHRIYLVDRIVSYLDSGPIQHMRWGTALVDHAPEADRPKSVALLRDRADVIICHDADEDYYGDALEGFKSSFIQQWPRGATGAFSDVVDVVELLDLPDG